MKHFIQNNQTQVDQTVDVKTSPAQIEKKSTADRCCLGACTLLLLGIVGGFLFLCNPDEDLRMILAVVQKDVNSTIAQADIWVKH